MSFFQRAPLQYATSPHPEHALIWLHGLGADGYDFAGFVEALAGISKTGLRFVFPHAPIQPVTLNNGATMPSWFDLYGTRPEDPQDELGIRRAREAISGLIQEELQRGIASERIILGGFSQGGALALYTALSGPHRLAAAVGLSTYLPLASRFRSELRARNKATPVFLGHGTEDLTLPYDFALLSHAVLAQSGVAAELHSYPLDHSVSAEEIQDLRRFLTNALTATGLGADGTSV